MPLKPTKLIALSLALSLAVPTLSFAKAGGRSSSGSGSSSGGMTYGSEGSRGSRTYDNNSYRPIERSTTPQPTPSAAGPAPVAPQPVSQPSFFQRHPILTGLAAGFAGSWIGHMLFGANNSMANSDAKDSAEETGGNMGMLLLFVALGAAALYYFMRVRRQPSLAPTGPVLRRESASDLNVAAPESRSGFMTQQPDIATVASPQDETSFRDILVNVQTAWSKQNLEALKRVTTPEMLHYFSSALTENTSKDVENRVEDVTILKTETRESWTENAVDYATALLQWNARDYTVSLSKQRGEQGYVVDGSEATPVESTEAWTFMRYHGGKWLLSAIQQVE